MNEFPRCQHTIRDEDRCGHREEWHDPDAPGCTAFGCPCTEYIPPVDSADPNEGRELADPVVSGSNPPDGAS